MPITSISVDGFELSDANPLPTSIDTLAAPTTLVFGQTAVTTAGTAVALGPTTALAAGVMVKARSGNAGLVYVGASDVASGTGFELAAGESVFLAIADLATVFIDAATSGDAVSYIGS